MLSTTQWNRNHGQNRQPLSYCTYLKPVPESWETFHNGSYRAQRERRLHVPSSTQIMLSSHLISYHSVTTETLLTSSKHSITMTELLPTQHKMWPFQEIQMDLLTSIGDSDPQISQEKNKINHPTYHRQAMAIPTESSIHVKSTLVSKSCYYVFNSSCKYMSIMWKPCGKWRSIIECKPKYEVKTSSEHSETKIVYVQINGTSILILVFNLSFLK